jgi:RNA polymerase sigma-70 factor (ECF subfamily)
MLLEGHGKADSQSLTSVEADLAQADGSGRDASNESADKLIADLYRREVKPLRQYIGYVMRSSSDAEDIVQESFIRLWRALALSDIQSPRAVLFKTARNLAFNQLRDARVRNSEKMRAAIDETLAGKVATAEENLIQSEDAAGCQLLMECLPLRCREAFVLRVVDELSYKEMSHQMGLSISTIEKHISKGKQICRSLVQKRDSLLDFSEKMPKLGSAPISSPGDRNPAFALAAE